MKFCSKSFFFRYVYINYYLIDRKELSLKQYFQDLKKNYPFLNKVDKVSGLITNINKKLGKCFALLCFIFIVFCANSDTPLFAKSFYRKNASRDTEKVFRAFFFICTVVYYCVQCLCRSLPSPPSCPGGSPPLHPATTPTMQALI